MFVINWLPSNRVNVYLYSPSLQSLQVDSQGLNGAIVKTCTLAESISGKVRILDTAKVQYMEGCGQRGCGQERGHII